MSPAPGALQSARAFSTLPRKDTMATSAPLPDASPAVIRKVAPWLHTVFVLVLMLFLSLGGSQGRQRQQVEQHGRIPVYLFTMAAEWAIVGFIWYSIRRQGVPLRELVGGKWTTFESALLDAAIAFGFWIAAAIVLIGAGFALGLARSNLDEVKKTIGFLAPHTGPELLMWLAVCLTAGFCEEVIFRGFFQRQFAALIRSGWGGVVLQALLFGAAHGYQGPRRMAQIAVFGGLFGVLALLRKSLRPGMMAHAWQDGLAGVALFVIGKIQGW